MKRKLFFLTLVLLAIILLLLSGCEKSPNPLSSPVVTLDKETMKIQWEEVENAISYEVIEYVSVLGGDTIEGMPYLTAYTEYKLSRSGQYYISVQAKARNALSNSEITVFKIEIAEKTNSELGEYPSALDLIPVSLVGSFVKESTENYKAKIDGNFEKVEIISPNISALEWEYNSDQNIVTIQSTYLNKYSIGARVSLLIEKTDKEENVFKEEILIIVQKFKTNNLKYLPTVGYYSYNIASPTFLMINISNNNYEDTALAGDVDGVVVDTMVLSKGLLGGDYQIEVSSNTQLLTINKNFLRNLKSGMHNIFINTKHGIIVTKLFVYSQDYTPQDLIIDPDSSYPDIYLRWEVYGEHYEDICVEIGELKYKRSEYPNLFNDNSFNLKGLYSEQTQVSVTVINNGFEFKSKEITLNIYDSYSKYLSYDNSYYFLGTNYNSYIYNDEEMKYLAFYLIMNFHEYKVLTDNVYTFGVNVALDMISYPMTFNVDGKVQSTFSATIKSNIGKKINLYPEGYSYEELVVEDLGYGVFSITIKNVKSFSVPISDSEFSNSTKSEYAEMKNQLFTIGGREANYNNFPINMRDGAIVNTSDELYMVVELGFRPEPISGSSAERIYNIAKEVLNSIIDVEMTNYEKYIAIYEWVALNVIYDYETTKKMDGISPTNNAYSKFYAYRCFYLEGVFIDGIAVCNGMSKAISLMCNIEGIECYKISGTTRSKVAHAWNKVNIDGIWYVSDITWGNTLRADSKEEYLTHEYILMSEIEANASRSETSNRNMSDFVYAIDDGYDYYASTIYYYNGNILDRKISSEEELIQLLEYLAIMNNIKNTIGKDSIIFDIQCIGGYMPDETKFYLGYRISDTLEIGQNNVYVIKLTGRLL